MIINISFHEDKYFFHENNSIKTTYKYNIRLLRSIINA